MWGAIGWGTMSIVSGVCVDWFSEGLDYKNYTPGFIISLMCSILNVYVVSTIKVYIMFFVLFLNSSVLLY